MVEKEISNGAPVGLTRRKFLQTATAGGLAIFGALAFNRLFVNKEPRAEAFIASAGSYEADIKAIILQGINELGFSTDKIKGKRVLLKPNLVEPHRGVSHINTHPLVIRAASEAFFSLGAAEVVVGEGAGHTRDSLLVLEESGLAEVLYEDKIPFIDLNNDDVVKIKNYGRSARLNELFIPKEIMKADLLVSVAKMKTHHWVGVTLSMKNLFGLMPGTVYGWPKNVLHWAGINRCIFDINASVKPDLAIVDGIVGMEGDGPIMGDPIQSNVIVMSKNFPAVDATCARIMGIGPEKIHYLKRASGRIGTIRESNIEQRGERIDAVQRKFKLLDYIPAHKGIRL